MTRQSHKPFALQPGSTFSLFSPASPAESVAVQAGLRELRSLGFSAAQSTEMAPDGYFAGDADSRLSQFLDAARNPRSAALLAVRGGYGSNYLLDSDLQTLLSDPKPIIGFSDLTSLQIYLWQKLGWVTFHGPMLAAGLDHGAGAANGYDKLSFQQALTNSTSSWSANLGGAPLREGLAEGCLLGGCLTLVAATLGTPWELDTSDSILILEDRAMRPYQVDRVLMQLKHAGKFAGVKAIILGEFPESAPPIPGSPTVLQVCERILAPLGIPIVFGATVGHTPRPMLTLPLGVRAKLQAKGEGRLEILERAVLPRA